MPNPRAQKPLSFDQIIKDAKSLGVPAQALLDALAGGVKGSFTATAGAPADIYNLLNQVSFRGQLPTMPYGSEDISKMLPDVIPTQDKSRQHTAEFGETMGSFIPTPMAGQALKGAVKLGAKGARALGEEAGRRAVMGESFTPFVNTAIPQTYVIKPKGGNWFKNEVENNLERLKSNNREISPSLFEGFEQSAKDPTDPYHERSIRRLREHNNEIALNNWVGKNLTNYVKKEMGTPEDPVRLAIDSRVAEAKAKYKEDMARADRIAQRATEETDPRRQANLQREANRLTTEANNNLELGIKHSSHLPHDPDYLTAEVIKLFKKDREEQGFPAEGMGKSDQAKAYEINADNSIYPIKASSLQELPERFAQEKLAKKEAEQAQIDLDAKLTKHIKNNITGVTDEQIKYIVNKMGLDEKERMVGDNTLSKAYQKLHNVLSHTDEYNLKRLEQNPYINKLAPDTNIYSAQTGDLGFDHILDVLKEDLASGRMKPEDLKNISVEQAVRKTADYDLALAKKMQDAQAKKLEGMTVHKEYPEGMRWVQLDKPGQFASESEAMGHSVRGYEPPEGHPDWIPESGNSGSDYYGHGGWEGIKSGKAKVYSLVDPKGNPHTTVEINQSLTTTPNDFKKSGLDYNEAMVEAKRRMGITPENQKEWVQNSNSEQRIQASKDLYKNIDDIYKEKMGNLPQSISQIKGKSNRAPNENYLPYVQDFVKSGNWGDVGDLHNTGLYKLDKDFLGQISAIMPKAVDIQHLNRPQREEAILKAMDAGELQPGYITRNEYESAIRKHGTPTYGKVTDDLLNQLQAPIPPVEGMKKGGAVHISDNPDTMFMELMDKKMKGGGAEDDTKLTPSQWLQAQGNKPIEPFTPIEDLTANLKAIANVPSRMYEGAKQLVTDPRAYFADMKAPTVEELAMAFNPSSVGLAGMATKVGKLNAIDALFPNKTENMLNSAEKSALTTYKKDLDVPAVMRRELFRTAGTGDIETPSLKMRPEKGLNPDYLENKYVVPILWDTSGAGTNVSQIAGVPLSQGLRSSTPASVQKQGGRLYPLIEENAQQGVGGASMAGAASSKVNNLNTYSNKGPTVGVVMDMAEHGIDFSHHIAEPYIGMLNALRPSNDALKAFKEAIRKKPVINPITGAKVYPYTKFPGIDSPNIRDIIANGTDDYSAGNIRKAIAEVGDTYAMERLGFPKWSDIYKIMSMPDAKTGQSAKLILEVNPNTQIVTPNFEHGSYNTGMKANYAGGLADVNGNIVGVPDYVLLKRLFDERLAQGKSIGNVRSSLLKSHHGQLMTAEDIARLREYLGYDKPKKKAKGGAIKKAKGGEINEDDIQLEVRPL